jgi:3-oxoacyl-[acyl-carrier protein] reductase
VNNAGLDAALPLLDPDWSQVDLMWALNYFAPWRFTQQAWHRYMREHGGSVINIASTAAAKARPIMAAYGMTKAALCDLTRRLAIETGPGVRVNCIAPGVVPTQMLREVFERNGPPPAVAEDGRGPWPLRRAGTVHDIAAAALYLASDASGWVTGQVMYVDGGACLL